MDVLDIWCGFLGEEREDGQGIVRFEAIDSGHADHGFHCFDRMFGLASSLRMSSKNRTFQSRTI